jgi:hypothetical protein
VKIDHAGEFLPTSSGGVTFALAVGDSYAIMLRAIESRPSKLVTAYPPRQQPDRRCWCLSLHASPLTLRRSYFIVLADIAVAYANQNERDDQALIETVHSGRIEVSLER